MVKSNYKKLLIIILTVVIISCIATSVFAADPIIIGGNSTANTTTNTTTTNTTANVVTPTISNSTANTTANTTSTYTNTTSTLPKTGESDIYVVCGLILVCGISAVYAYKKIRDYNM